MHLTRRSLLTSLLAAPLIPVGQLIQPVPAPPILGPGWVPMAEGLKAFGYRNCGFGVWSDSLIIEAQRKTFISQLFGPGNIIEPKEDATDSDNLKGG